MILFSLFAFALYVAIVAPLAALVLEPLSPLDLARRRHALRTPVATAPGLTSAAGREVELRVRRRLYPGQQLST